MAVDIDSILTIINNLAPQAKPIEYGYEIVVIKDQITAPITQTDFENLKEFADDGDQYTAPSFIETLDDEMQGIPLKSDSKLKREFLSSEATTRSANITIDQWSAFKPHISSIDSPQRFADSDTIQIGVWDCWDKHAIYISIEN
ncbi:hypothetical protein [Lentilactobacillus kosonis]|uniref:Uncharacterized protein n=1 Tax=Lentilactobacillus kosonis TaxID=2810561 RepID=A0A401FKH8_9LACO|nr:hypothetical protein [Lentilactobacillus kosonis]GAY72890.1 hypothetical protein NBRC111893_1036 [Lentilactobacillus kosonis]